MTNGSHNTRRRVSKKTVKATIKRTVRDYRNTLRNLATGPRQAKRG